jgi:hypothetical protein
MWWYKYPIKIKINKMNGKEFFNKIKELKQLINLAENALIVAVMI